MRSNQRSAAVVIAVTLQRLSEGVDAALRGWSAEEALVLDALRRSKTSLANADASELAAYVSSLSEDAFRGVVSNVKGIYHEMLFVRAENLDGDAVKADLFDTTNHPGSDVQFTVDGDVVGNVQLKAVASAGAIREYLMRYPEIDIRATEEAAALVTGVKGSGFWNGELEADVRSSLDQLYGESLSAQALQGAATSALVAAAFAAGHVLREGRVDPRQLARAMGDIGIGVVAATSLDVLLGMTS